MQEAGWGGGRKLLQFANSIFIIKQIFLTYFVRIWFSPENTIRTILKSYGFGNSGAIYISDRILVNAAKMPKYIYMENRKMCLQWLSQPALLTWISYTLLSPSLENIRLTSHSSPFVETQWRLSLQTHVTAYINKFLLAVSCTS